MRSATKPTVGALVSAVAAISCNGSQSGSQSQTPTTSPTVQVQPAADSAMSAAPTTAGPAAGSAGAEESRLAELRARAEWRAFKALWRELDAISPPKGDAGRRLEREVYAHAIDADQAGELSKRLAEVGPRLEQSKLLSPEQAAFLRHLASARIRNMRQGSMPLMVMHRMPPPYAWKKVVSVDKLEQRIDVLVDLRAKGRLSASEYDLALEQVRREAVTSYVLYEIGRGGYAMGAETIEVTDGESMLAEMARRSVDAGADAGAHEQLLRDIATRAKALVPAVRALITELER
jgi:hypothetical protein